MNIGQVLTSRANLLGEKVGFIHQEKEITFAEMNDRANSFAQYLLAKGLKAGDKIALLCKNNEHVIAGFFGAAKLGIVTVVLNYRLQLSELQYIVEHSDASLIVYDDIFSDIAEKLNVPIISAASLHDIYIVPANEPTHATADNDPILMMYTSGTTGLPKGALISHNNLQAASIGLSHTVDWWEQDRFLMVAPFFHIGGFAPLITNVHVGTTMIFMEDFYPVEAWKIIQQQKITTMMTVPTMLAFLLQTYPMVNPDTTSMRNMTCGASAVPSPLILGFKQLGIPIQQVYGITEYTGAVSFWKETQDPAKYDSMGKPVMHGSIRIVDTETKETVPSGTIGEIVISGPQIFVGYYKNEESYKKTVQNGELFSGDVGYLDEKGFLYVIDRLKDMIISGGENIYSAEIELALTQHPAIAEVAVIGVPNEKWGEVPKAYVVAKPDVTLTTDEVIAFCKEKLASYKCVKEVEFIDQLPRNAVGKILKIQLKVMNPVK